MLKSLYERVAERCNRFFSGFGQTAFEREAADAHWRADLMDYEAIDPGGCAPPVLVRPLRVSEIGEARHGSLSRPGGRATS